MTSSVKNPVRRKNWVTWFDPRGRQTGGWAYILNRAAGIGLSVYLFMHLIALGQLARGADAYDGFIALVKNPILIAGEFLVVAAGILHGLNGLRIILTSMGLGVRYQKSLFVGLMLVGLLACLLFIVRMFGEAS